MLMESMGKEFRKGLTRYLGLKVSDEIAFELSTRVQSHLRLDCGAMGTLLSRSLLWLAGLGPSPHGLLHIAATQYGT